jgi:hypothetical protein
MLIFPPFAEITDPEVKTRPMTGKMPVLPTLSFGTNLWGHQLFKKDDVLCVIRKRDLSKEQLEKIESPSGLILEEEIMVPAIIWDNAVFTEMLNLPKVLLPKGTHIFPTPDPEFSATAVNAVVMIILAKGKLEIGNPN